jgi:plasmid stability protein
MTTLTIKLPAELKQRLELEASQSGRSISALIREAVTERLRAGETKTSLYDRTRDLCGAGASGRPDLATNPDHLEGLGE